MLSLSVILSCLKYLGLVVATFSSLWGTWHEVTTKDKSGRKHLTKEGKLSVVLTVGALIVSASMIFVSGLLARTEAAQKAVRERQRTREIIVSGQPLRSFRLEWIFKNVGEDFRKKVAEAESDIEEMPDVYEEQFKYLYARHREAAFAFVRRYYELYPWLGAIATGKWGKDADGGEPFPVVALLSFDKAASSILPFGVLNTSAKEEYVEQGIIQYYTQDNTKDVAGSVEFIEELDLFFRMEMELAPTRTRSCQEFPRLKVNGSDVEVEWEIGPASLYASVDRASPEFWPSGNFPDRLRILILTSIADLPAGPANFTNMAWPLPWSGSEPEENPVAEASTLVLYPNNLDDFPGEYEMKYLGIQPVEDTGFETEFYYCNAAIWEGERVRDSGR